MIFTNWNSCITSIWIKKLHYQHTRHVPHAPFQLWLPSKVTTVLTSNRYVSFALKKTYVNRIIQYVLLSLLLLFDTPPLNRSNNLDLPLKMMAIVWLAEISQALLNMIKLNKNTNIWKLYLYPGDSLVRETENKKELLSIWQARIH